MEGEGRFLKSIALVLGRPEVVRDGEQFSIRSGEAVYFGRDPESTELWNRPISGKKRAMLFTDSRLTGGEGGPALSRCAGRIALTDRGIRVDKEAGLRGKSGKNPVWIWYQGPSGWERKRLIDQLAEDQWKKMNPQDDGLRAVVIDIETAAGLVRLNWASSNGRSRVDYRVEFTPGTDRAKWPIPGGDRDYATWERDTRPLISS